MSLRALLFVPLFCSVTFADAAPASFGRWVHSYAKQHTGALRAWWSADVDDDGQPDSIAIVCTPDEDEAAPQGAFLIEAAGKRFTTKFLTLDSTGGPACVPAATRPPFRRTTDKTIRLSVSTKRGSDVVQMAIREGKLVVVKTDFGGGRYCKHLNAHAYDFLEQSYEDSHLTEKDFVWVGQDSCKLRRGRVSTEALLLVTQAGVPTTTRTNVVSGKRSHTGDADASFGVTVTQPTATTLELRIPITDDVERAPTDRSEAALAKADHIEVWIGAHAVKLARDASGEWFALGDAATVVGAGNEVRLTLPFKWASWQREDGVMKGSLVVAYQDVDEEGEPTVLATVPSLTRRPRGMLMKLPGAARWPSVGNAVPDAFNADGECSRSR